MVRSSMSRWGFHDNGFDQSTLVWGADTNQQLLAWTTTLRGLKTRRTGEPISRFFNKIKAGDVVPRDFTHAFFLFLTSNVT